MDKYNQQARDNAPWEDYPLDDFVFIPNEINCPQKASNYLKGIEIARELDETFLNPTTKCSAQYYKERIDGLPDEFYGILEACSFTKPSIVKKQIINYQKKCRKKGRPCKNQPIFEIHSERRTIQFD